jgi:hypothetical protein
MSKRLAGAVAILLVTIGAYVGTHGLGPLLFKPDSAVDQSGGQIGSSSQVVAGCPQTSDPTVDQIKSCIASYGAIPNGWDQTIATATATCESGLNPKSSVANDGDGTPSWGLFMIHRPWLDRWDDYHHNIDVAFREYYTSRKWQPWSTDTVRGPDGLTKVQRLLQEGHCAYR